jgi:hypothetical protein
MTERDWKGRDWTKCAYWDLLEGAGPKGKDIEVCLCEESDGICGEECYKETEDGDAADMER